VTTAAGDVTAGPSSANQNATNGVTGHADNSATTNQSATQSQMFGGSGGCSFGCGGPGAAQLSVEKVATEQLAAAKAIGDETAVNGNAPVTTAGGNVTAGPSSANQNATSNADGHAGNSAATGQSTTQGQTLLPDRGTPCGCLERPMWDD
jgi:hypothetical protein